LASCYTYHTLLYSIIRYHTVSLWPTIWLQTQKDRGIGFLDEARYNYFAL